MSGCISTTAPWFEIWQEAFGGPDSGIWTHEGISIPYVKRRSIIAGLPVSSLQGATNDHTPRYDILSGDEDCLADALSQMFRDFSVSLLSFSYLDRDARLLRPFLQGQGGGLLYHIDHCEFSPYVDCTLPWEQYWQSRGRSRATWARRERKLMDKMGAEFAIITDRKDADSVLEEIYDVEASGWKGRKGTAIKQQPATLRFYTRLIQHAADSGMLRLFVLRLEGRIIAFQVTTFTAGTISMLKIGYLEELARLSPGQALQIRILRWAFEQPEVKVFDLLGGGGEAYQTKLRWATDQRELFTLRLFRKDPAGLWAWGRYVAGPRVKGLLRHARAAIRR
ncbi:MAG TPA: GNAT family N-acetyltransferase [Gammaproteobacteria bacterium]|nr:GNAT family N-acetyltransferase [Gammaproteobacteria bacterium]